MTQSTARILIVEDEAHIREGLKRGMEWAGCEIATTPDAQSAEELLREKDFDLVLLDIIMPGKSGMDLLPEIRDQYPDVAVVMLTGVGDASTAVRAMREGAYDYATKPVTLAELVVRVEHALSRRDITLENQTYHLKLERLVSELNARLEQRQRELRALNKLFGSRVGQEEAVHAAYSQLEDSLASFTHELEGLATIVGMSGDHDEVASGRDHEKKDG